MSADLAPGIPAATLVLLRDQANGPAECLMIERSGQMVFAPGALVFPGGRIDPGDVAVAANDALVGAMPPPDAAARIAAIRETIEEVGVAVGITPAPDAAALAAWRAALADGADFAALLAAAGCRVALDALVPFARWMPNMRETRRFDTLFFAARAPDDAVAVHDGTESVHAAWLSPQAFLDEADGARFSVIFPTRRNLERLAHFADTAAAFLAHAARTPVQLITPWIEPRDGVDHLCIPEGLGYPVTAEPMDRVRRG